MDHLAAFPQHGFSTISVFVQDLDHPGEFILTLLDAFHDRHLDLFSQVLAAGWRWAESVLGRLKEIGGGGFKVALREQEPDSLEHWKRHGDALFEQLRKADQRLLFIVDEFPDYDEPKRSAAYEILSKLSVCHGGIERTGLSQTFDHVILDHDPALPGHERKRRFNFLSMRPRLLAIYRMTGGSPRLALMLYEWIATEEISEVKQPFWMLLDRITPYYQDRMSDLGPQEQAVLETMALIRDEPKTPAAIAERMRMKPAQTSALLGRLPFDSRNCRGASSTRTATDDTH
jgi:hypothetical protein